MVTITPSAKTETPFGYPEFFLLNVFLDWIRPSVLKIAARASHTAGFPDTEPGLYI
jgi:hypothetical protein